MDEFERIAWLRARFERAGVPPDVALGIGDDAAVLAPSDLHQVVSVDAAVEGVHFRWSFADPGTLAARALTAALSDLAAMGAKPRAALCAMTLAPDVDNPRFMALVEGYAEAAERYGVSIVGGNLTSGAVTSITTTVIGDNDGWVGRNGARCGDTLYVTGPLGGAGAGLQALLHGSADPVVSPFVERWRAPTARLDLVGPLRRYAHAAIDLSDGLIQDVAHMCRASNVGVSLDLDAIPLPAHIEQAASLLGRDALDLALHAGEDYELALTADGSLGPAPWAFPVGQVVAEHPGAVRLYRQGIAVPMPAEPGFQHFDRHTGR